MDSYFDDGKISEKSFLSLGKFMVLSKIEEFDFLRGLLEVVFELYFVNN